MASRKKNKRRQKKRSRARKARPLLPTGLQSGAVTVLSGGAEKMSEVLMEFLEPYTKHWKTEEDLRKLLTLGIVAWNAALVTGSTRDELIQSTSEVIPPELRQGLRSILDEMIQRKESYFANNKRMIIDYELTMGPAGPYLSVISTLESS